MAGYSGQTEITRRVEFNAIGLDPLIRSHMVAHGHDQHPAYQSLMDGIDEWLVELEGTNPDHAEFVRENREAFEKKLHDYAMKEGFGEVSVAGYRTHIVNETGSGGIGGKSGEKRAARQAYKEALLATLMDQGRLPAYIADQVFGQMDDHEIAEVVEDIEAATGMAFQEYAATILGEEDAQFLPGESLEDYRRRILDAITLEVLGPDGKVRPQYANDPVAGIILDNENYHEAMARVEDWQAREAGGENDADIALDVDRETEGEFASGDLAGHTLEGPQAVDAGRVNQDDETDIEGSDVAAAAENADIFNAMAGFADTNTDGLVSPPSALDQASLNGTFNAASALPPDDQAPHIDMVSQPNSDTLTT